MIYKINIYSSDLNYDNNTRYAHPNGYASCEWFCYNTTAPYRVLRTPATSTTTAMRVLYSRVVSSTTASFGISTIPTGYFAKKN